MQLYVNDRLEDIKPYTVYEFPRFAKILMGFLDIPETIFSEDNGEDYEGQEVDNDNPFVVSFCFYSFL